MQTAHRSSISSHYALALLLPLFCLPSLTAQTPYPQPTMGQLVGVNSRISDPVVWQKKFGFVREYHEWANDIGYDSDATANCPPTGKYKWNPSYDDGNALETFNVYYANLAYKVSPSTKGLAPEMRGYSAYPSCPKLLEQKPICKDIMYTWAFGCPPSGSYNTMPDYNWLTSTGLSNHEDPALYIDHAKWNTLLAARYGQGYNGYLLNYPPFQTAEAFVPYPRINYIENANEPEKSWYDDEHGLQNEVSGLTGKTYWQMTAPQFAAMLSADFDGHGGSAALAVPGLSGRYFGVAKSTSSTKMVMGGLADLRTGYVADMKAWFEAKRVAGQYGFVSGPKYPFDVLNFHHYSTDNNRPIGTIQASTDAKNNPLVGSNFGICPECDDLRADLTATLSAVNAIDPVLGAKEVWFSEFGYDAHFGSAGSTPSVVEVDVTDPIKRQLRQAQWLVRSFLEISAAKGDANNFISKAMAFDLRDNASMGFDGGLFDHCGLLTSTFQPKRSWYYVQTLRNVLKDYKFAKDIVETPALNDCGIANPNLRIYRFNHKDDANKKIFAIWRWHGDAHTVLDDISCKVKIPITEFGASALATRIEIVNFDENGRKYIQEAAIVGNYVELNLPLKLGETPIFIIPGIAVEDPVTPLVSAVTATSVCCGAVRLTWVKPNPFHDPRIISHLIYYTKDPGIVANPALFEMSKMTLFNQTWTNSVIIPGLESGTAYRFFVMPIDNYLNIPDLTSSSVLTTISTTITVTDCSAPDNTCQDPVGTCILKLDAGCFATGYAVNEIFTCSTSVSYNLYDRAKETFGLLDQEKESCAPLNTNYALGCPGNGWTGYNYQNPAANYVELNFGGAGNLAKHVKVNTIYIYDVQGVGDLVVEYKNCACTTWQFYKRIKTNKYDQWVAIYNLPTFPVSALRFVKTSDGANVARVYLCTEPVTCTPPMFAYNPGTFSGLAVKEVEPYTADLEWNALKYNQTDTASSNMDGYTLRYSTQKDGRGELVNPVEEVVEADIWENKVNYQVQGLQPSTTYFAEVEGAKLPPYRPCRYPILAGEVYVYPRQQTSFTTAAEQTIDRDAGSQADPKATPAEVLKLYPNPGKGLLNVTFPSTGFSRIKVTNAQGQVVQTIEVNAQDRYIDLDLSQLPVGVYTISADEEGGRKVSARYVKMD